MPLTLQRERRIYVASRGHGAGQGVFLYGLDETSGECRLHERVAALPNAHFLAIDRLQRFLYATNDENAREGEPGGQVSAFAIEPATGRLTLINRQPTHGASPCHVTLDPSGRCLLVTNYRKFRTPADRGAASAGCVAAYPVAADGSIGPPQVLNHPGSSVHPQRQTTSHPHSSITDPSGRRVIVADLGIDKLMMYRIGPAGNALVPDDPPWVEMTAGSGPRHMAFDAAGRHLYLINELANTVSVFAYEESRGRLTLVQTLPTLPPDFPGQSAAADIHLSVDGRFVYGSNRGHDSIAIFRVHAASGRLEAVGHEPSRGKSPRNFAIDPAGGLLLAAHEGNNTIVTFRIDPQTGALAATGLTAEAPCPLCVKVL